MHRSQLKAMQLLAIAKKPVIKKCGCNQILRSFMTQLNQLEQVITVHVHVIDCTAVNICGERIDYNYHFFVVEVFWIRRLVVYYHTYSLMLSAESSRSSLN